MRDYIHATIASTFAWAGNIYDLLTYVYSYFEKVYSPSILDFSILFALGRILSHVNRNLFIFIYYQPILWRDY